MDDCDRFFYGFIHFRFGNFNRFRSWVAGGENRLRRRYRRKQISRTIPSAGILWGAE
jgi:hypothetical protein